MRKRLKWLGVTVALAVTVASVAAGAPAAANAGRPAAHSLVVRTEAGTVEGKTTGAVDSFLGIPFAAPPVGGLRWQPPQPAAAWPGVRPATAYGPACPQGSGPVVTEDCLYLNVYRPARPTNERLPVLLWIHGGGFSSGSGDAFDGSLLAETNNIVVVTINYRLGVFGFLDLPGLSQAGAGNYGLLDQVAALTWANRNIDRFGGDRDAVTVAGLSAGGHSVCALLSSPLTHGLIDGAIIQSGGCPSHTVAESQAAGARFAADAGCATTADPVACLRAKPAAQILGSSAAFRGGILSGPLPTAGVPELPVAPLTAVRTGRFAKVPLLIGSTHDEVRAWAQPFRGATAAQYEKSLEYLFGDRAADVEMAYPLSNFPAQDTVAYALGAVWTDSSVFYGLGGCQYAQLTQQIARYQPKTFLYRFDARSPSGPVSPGAFDVGATHAADQAYLWPTPASVYDRDGLRLSTEMVRYWGAFARQGTPDAAGQAEWPGVSSGRVMILQPGGSSTVTSAAFAAAHHCDLWNGMSYQWLDIDPDQLAQRVGVARR
ncbi:carboxylesterase/lipase family protein [Amycolatopsis australiensis]|uniref:Carboxylic ester hydrolase n=1 Tax=Amycolatopsis australiensis TaxID=546364 RepID=A0A1K1S341_9PSEU|nr:carboxylesterase family protein [Amycolatopsis australiensis]SFW78503.1 para-nitrobenzyl esterase [Amycolatopsis australiensis]